MEKVSFKTQDNVTIVGNYWPRGTNEVLLLHMMPATKESWNDFAEKLADKNFSVLAIDLRGHGESIEQNGMKLNYKVFSDAQHQSSIKDVEAAAQFLKEKGGETLSLAGASIGANLALEYQAQHPEVKKTILLSAGTMYRGLETIPYARQLQDDQEVYFVAGSFDGRSAGSAETMAKDIAGEITSETQMKIYATTAHGTDIFSEYPQFMDELVLWVQSESLLI